MEWAYSFPSAGDAHARSACAVLLPAAVSRLCRPPSAGGRKGGDGLFGLNIAARRRRRALRRSPGFPRCSAARRAAALRSRGIYRRSRLHERRLGCLLDEQKAFEAGFTAARDGWTGAKQSFAGLGTFIEVLSPSVSVDHDIILFARPSRRCSCLPTA